MTHLFDTHCHLEDERFAEDREAVIARLEGEGVMLAVTVGSDLASSRRCISLAETHPMLYAAAGVHPHEAKDAGEGYLDELRALLSHPRVKALGEIGLDYYYDLSPRDVQRRVFEEQLALAHDTDTPVILHIRDAHGEALEILRAHRKELTGGIVHCYSGSVESVKEYLNLGFHISFAGPVTYKNAAKLREAAQSVPPDRLLIETDSPYLSPEPKRGQRNQPAHVRYVCEKLAGLRGMEPQEMAALTWRNAHEAYRLPINYDEKSTLSY